MPPVFGIAGLLCVFVGISLVFAEGSAASSQEVARPFGLTVAEWVMLLGALGTFVEAMRQRRGKRVAQGRELTTAQKLQAVQEAFGETMAAHPDLRRKGRDLANKKATKMGISLTTLECLLESKDDSADPEAEKAADPEGDPK